jgi:predicted HicB family RNase H-like nuclease
MLTYNGYIGDVDYDDNAETFYGKVINANVLVSFRGRTVEELKDSFHHVVDAYLEDCKENGVEPAKPYNGTLTVRVDPVVHRRVALKASAIKVSMNKYVEGLLARDTEDMAAYDTRSGKGSGKKTAAKVGRRVSAKKAAGSSSAVHAKRRPVA